MIRIRKAADRGHAQYDWLDTWHTFSFDTYHNPAHMGFRSLRVMNEDLPAIDIEIEKNKVREHCLELYPDREELYEMIYESRFQRLWDQFRDEEGERI